MTLEPARRDASIDELLRGAEEEPEEPKRPDTTKVWLLKSLVWSAGLAGFIVFSGRAMTFNVPYLLAFGVVAAMFLLFRVVRDVGVPQATPGGAASITAALAAAGHVPSTPRDDDWQITWPTPDGLFAAASRWHTRLSWTQTDPERFTSNVLPAIGELVDERLRQKHGFTRSTDPQRARALLGDPLWTFLSTPLKRSLTPQQLAVVVSQLEAL